MTYRDDAWSVSFAKNKIVRFFYLFFILIMKTLFTWLSLLSLWLISLPVSTFALDEQLLARAHAYAYDHQITSVQSLNRFRPELSVTREQASKMIVWFARDYLGDEYFFRADKTLDCDFVDKTFVSKDLRSHVIESCRFGIFRGDQRAFNPKGTLTVWQARIVLWRITGKVVATGDMITWSITRWDLIVLMYQARE